jgi:hypothetical protein
MRQKKNYFKGGCINNNHAKQPDTWQFVSVHLRAWDYVRDSRISQRWWWRSESGLINRYGLFRGEGCIHLQNSKIQRGISFLSLPLTLFLQLSTLLIWDIHFSAKLFFLQFLEPEDGGSNLLRNVCEYLPIGTTLYSRRPEL